MLCDRFNTEVIIVFEQTQPKAGPQDKVSVEEVRVRVRVYSYYNIFKSVGFAKPIMLKE